MNSTNIKVMSEEIQHLKNEVHNLDVEIPDHPATDAGKYLGVAADGSLAWSKVPDELPPTTGASAGQILALDNNKAPEWVDNYNLNYSETEINTGKKWIDGKNIYIRAFGGNLPIITETGSQTLIVQEVDSIINSHCVTFTTTGGVGTVRPLRYLKSSTHFYVESVGSTYSEGAYQGFIEYTKPTPSALTSSDHTREAEPEIIEEPEPETKSTRTKKSTK